MDFYQICTREIEKGPNKGKFEMYPDFVVGRSKDLMVRGKSFYAIWDEEAGLWSTDEYDVQRLVDADLRQASEKMPGDYIVRYMRSANNGIWYQFRKYMQNIGDNHHQLDSNLTFADTEVKKSDYVSKRLPYSLQGGDCPAWDELVGTLYSVEERAKIEWIIGAIVSGDSKKLQKFAVFYGPPGTGKSTILNVIDKLFVGYTTAFDAKALGASGAQFATEIFKENPLVGIQQDGDLSKIEDNARLNTIVSHEYMTMNEKFKASYTAKILAFLLLGTNQPVKISDAKSGIIRRLLDIHPTGVKIPTNHYFTLMSQIDFELGAIAAHCLEVYRSLGKNHYNGYKPLEMMLQTDVFFNFVEWAFDTFKEQDSTTLKQAYALYKEFCSETGIDRVMPQYKFREELRNYFEEFKERAVVDGVTVRSQYVGFTANKFKVPTSEPAAFSLVVEETESLLDELFADQPAQGWALDPFGDKRPEKRWKNVKTTLKDIDTSDLHFVKIPENHIVIDFDLKDINGTKSLERNLEAASSWPPTYAELSQGGGGVHLHYLWDGLFPVEELAALHSDGIEVKTLLGDSSLRRRLTKCNNIPVATLKTGLAQKENKPVLSDSKIQSEKGLRSLIHRALKKEFGNTKPMVDFIHKILDDAYKDGLDYDVTDLRSTIIAFANNSSNQPVQSLAVVQRMKFKGQNVTRPEEAPGPVDNYGDDPVPEERKDERIVLFDVEVYPNLFVICWKYRGSDTVVKMINPTAVEVENIVKTLKLAGFNCRRYDNHILYAAMMGYNNLSLFNLSQAIIANERQNLFGEAYNLSYADLWEIASKKQTLKLWQIELGYPHIEMDLSWDKPVPKELWDKIVDYCCNDVESTEGVLDAIEQDMVAREMLAALSGLSINDTTQRHTAKIIFGNERRPQTSFVYTDLSTMFPGYVFDHGKSSYRGEDPSEGGYVYAEPGIYENVAVLDVVSMHPTSLINLNAFGTEYTSRFKALVDTRVAIKRGDLDSARAMMDGRFAPFLKDVSQAKELSYALKIIINIVYGMTSAKFDNPFKDMRNKDNIVAKRGALFMIDLKNFVQERGFTVAHIKTDSIKIPNATEEIIRDVMLFGEKYGYEFEHETTYDKFCLVNGSTYIAKKRSEKDPKEWKWDAVAAQFQHPYVFKTLFSQEPLVDKDFFEVHSVQKGRMYLDFEQDLPEPTTESMTFVGRVGQFVPVESNGGILYRVDTDKDGNTKNYAVTGTKGFQFVEASMFNQLGEHKVDMSYFEKLAQAAIKQIEKYGSYEEFVS